MYENITVVRLLLGLGGADPTMKDEDGLTAQDMAKKLQVEMMLNVCMYNDDVQCRSMRKVDPHGHHRDHHRHYRLPLYKLIG